MNQLSIELGYKANLGQTSRSVYVRRWVRRLIYHFALCMFAIIRAMRQQTRSA